MIIVRDGERRIEIQPGRLAALIRWLIEHREKFEELEKVQLVFDCAGQQAKIAIREHLTVESVTAD